jgi:Predicted metal-dependent hydrolase of the TIM-barrel fold
MTRNVAQSRAFPFPRPASLPALRALLLVPLALLLAVVHPGPSRAEGQGGRAIVQPVAPAGAPERSALLAGYAAELRAVLARGQTPIIDVEHHWGGKLPLAALVGKMDKAGVALTWLGQNERNGSVHALADAAAYPTRLVPTTIHGDGPRWHGRDPSLLTELAADVATGRYFAMGEFEARHYVSSTNDRDVHLPVDSESFEAVFRLAEESGLPFLLHHEAEDALLPELERMLVRHPKAKVIWCHVGRNRNRATWTVLPTPEGVRAMLVRYPNLYFDLNQSPPGSTHRGTRQVDAVLYDNINPDKGKDQPDARLNSQWRALFEEHADRFVFGSDVNTGRWDNYERVTGNFRWLILRSLSPEAGAKIAYQNAWRLMSGQDWR